MEQQGSARGQRRLSGLESAVEHRLGEKRAGQLQDLVGLAQLLDLALELLDPLHLRRRRSLPLAGLTFVLVHPVGQGLRRAADLGRDGFDRRPLRRVLAAGLGNHAHGALADLGAELR